VKKETRAPGTAAPARTNRHLTVRFFLYLFGLSLGLVVILSSFYSWYFFRQLTSNFELEARTRLLMFEEHLNSFITHEIEELQGYHRVFAGQDLDQLVRLVDENPRYRESLILDPQGIVLHATDPIRLGYRYGQAPFFQTALASSRAQFLPQFHPLDNQLIIHLVIPVSVQGDQLSYMAVHELNPHCLRFPGNHLHESAFSRRSCTVAGQQTGVPV